jgi:anti-anti-sigma factor
MVVKPGNPNEPFSIRSAARGRVHSVRLRGELDLAYAQAVGEALRAARCSTLEVDLTELTFLDAAGLSAVVSARAEVMARGCHVRVVGASGIVRQVFTVTGLGGVLDS